MNSHLLCSEIVEKALNYIGRDNMDALVASLEKSGVKMDDDIFDTYERLAMALERMFGEAASILEQQIIEETSARLNFHASTEMDFVQAMRQLRNTRQQMH